MKSKTPPFPFHLPRSLRRLRSELSSVKFALTCLTACFAFSAIPSVEAAPTPLEDFAGTYQGSATFTMPALYGAGTGDGRFSGNPTGGRIRLKADLIVQGNNIVVTRNIKIKKRSHRSISGFISGGTYSAGVGSGRALSQPKRVRYLDDSSFSGGGQPFTYRIRGEVRFFAQSVTVTETWSSPEKTFVFTYSMPRL